MKKLISSFLLCFALLEVLGQVNLVSNGSFEEYSQCPDPATLDPMPDNMIELATGWDNPTGYSPDYFHSCVVIANGLGVPQNGYGHQNARTGNAYAGLISMIETDGREYIQTQLATQLIAGKQYVVTFYVSLAESCLYSSNNMGTYFSNTPVSVTHSWVLPYTPQISNNPFTNPLTDRLGWTEVSDIFTALGGEKYMTIGNFKEDLLTDTVHINGVQNRSYHYIDDVSVVCIDCSVGISETNIDSRITVFPNPASDYLNINFSDIEIERFTILNSMGMPVIIEPTINDNFHQIDVAQYDSGLYFLKIETNNTLITKSFLIK